MTPIKKTIRWLFYAVAIALALAMLALAAVRFIVYPNIDTYKQIIATKTSQALGQKITIGKITPGWDGLSPRVVLSNVDVFDAEDRSALHLNTIEATLSWLSLAIFEPHLSELTIHQPKLSIHRKTDGSIFLAGINLASESKPDFANWLLSQARVDIKNAEITWQDDYRKAPILSLEKLNITLRNPAWRSIFGQHLFDITGNPSAGTKHPITVSGSFFGRDVSKIDTWHGKVYFKTKETDLTAWKPWLDYPVELSSGIASASTSLKFADSKIHEIDAYLELNNLITKLSETSEPLVTQHFSGQVSWDRSNQSTTLNLREIKMKASGGLNIEAGSGHIIQSVKNDKPWLDIAFNLNQFDLATILQLQAFVPIPQKYATKLIAFEPQGMLKGLSLSWVGEPEKPSRYSIKSQFTGLGIKPHNKIPGFENLSGDIDVDQNAGKINIDSKDALLNLKDILRWPIPATQLRGKISWRTNHDRPKIYAKNIIISNPHITGTINGSYDMNGVKGGYLDLKGGFERGDAKYALFYYPVMLGETTLHWLDTSILAGKAEDVHLTVKGSLADFPYVTKQNKLAPKLGTFKVTAKISDALVEYGTGWPVIEGLGLDMLFEGKRMVLNANKGRIFGNKIIKSKTEIPQLDADWPMLNIKSEIEGPVTDGIRFINESPIKEVTLGFTEGLKASGNGKLSLELNIPMEDLDASKYKGAYKIINGTMLTSANVGLPELSKINGTLNFTEKSLSAQNIMAEMLGGSTKFSLNTGTDKIINISANGRISAAGIKKIALNNVTQAIQGSTDWAGEITIKKPLVDLDIRSDLIGLGIELPSPLGKPSMEAAELTISKKQLRSTEDNIDIRYGKAVSAKIFRIEENGALTLERGDIGINIEAALPAEPGLSLHGQLDYVNADEWLAVFNKPTDNAKKSTLPVNKANLSIQKLDIFNRSLNALELTVKPSDAGLSLNIQSQEISGDAEWQSAKGDQDAGKIIARLKNLTIPSSKQNVPETAKKDIKKLERKYPALDITAENFQLGNKKLGSLELNAFESDDDWVIHKLRISNPDSTLVADGKWHNWAQNPNTNFKFNLVAHDIGNTLKRFGQPDAIKGGEAEIVGQLQWPGSPHEFETNGLSGNFKFEAKKGQVLKVKPGVGRLLGLLSLQSLPRRLSLDFRDLFSEGFAFDRISATARIDNGIMRSNDFFMTGPAAEASIKGETDLQKETQNLKVKVIPHISDSLSLAALAGGPIAGAAAFVAQKILKDPFNKIVQSEYIITGTWDNPQEAESGKANIKKENSESPLTQQ